MLSTRLRVYAKCDKSDVKHKIQKQQKSVLEKQEAAKNLCFSLDICSLTYVNIH